MDDRKKKWGKPSEEKKKQKQGKQKIFPGGITPCFIGEPCIV